MIGGPQNHTDREQQKDRIQEREILRRRWTGQHGGGGERERSRDDEKKRKKQSSYSSSSTINNEHSHRIHSGQHQNVARSPLISPPKRGRESARRSFIIHRLPRPPVTLRVCGLPRPRSASSISYQRQPAPNPIPSQTSTPAKHISLSKLPPLFPLRLLSRNPYPIHHLHDSNSTPKVSDSVPIPLKF